MSNYAGKLSRSLFSKFDVHSIIPAFSAISCCPWLLSFHHYFLVQPQLNNSLCAILVNGRDSSTACISTVVDREGLQDLSSESLEMQQPLAHLLMLHMAPANPGELFGVCGALLDPSLPMSSAQTLCTWPSDVASQAHPPTVG